MLVLTRKLGERVVISNEGGEVIITLLTVDVNKVKLGFEADRSFTIHREEVWERIQTGKQKS